MAVVPSAFLIIDNKSDGLGLLEVDFGSIILDLSLVLIKLSVFSSALLVSISYCFTSFIAIFSWTFNLATLVLAFSMASFIKAMFLFLSGDFSVSKNFTLCVRVLMITIWLFFIFWILSNSFLAFSSGDNLISSTLLLLVCFCWVPL